MNITDLIAQVIERAGPLRTNDAAVAREFVPTPGRGFLPRDADALVRQVHRAEAAVRVLAAALRPPTEDQP